MPADMNSLGYCQEIYRQLNGSCMVLSSWLSYLWTYFQLWPTCLKIFGEHLLDSKKSGQRGISKQRLTLWLVLAEVYVIDMLCCGNNKWIGEASWFSIEQLWRRLYWSDNILADCPFRRRQLAQLGSATGVYKTLVKYLVGVPQVWSSPPPHPALVLALFPNLDNLIALSVFLVTSILDFFQLTCPPKWFTIFYVA